MRLSRCVLSHARSVSHEGTVTFYSEAEAKIAPENGSQSARRAWSRAHFRRLKLQAAARLRYHRTVPGRRTAMDQRSFQRLLRRTVLIPVVLLMLLAVTLLVEILTLTRSLKWVDHAEQVISNSRQLMRYMVDMETGVRGYHLTGDKSFLEPYEAAKPRVPEQLTLLLKLTADTPGQQRRVKEIQGLDLRWIDYSDALLRQPVGNPLSLSEFQGGKDLMDQVR